MANFLHSLVAHFFNGVQAHSLQLNWCHLENTGDLTELSAEICFISGLVEIKSDVLSVAEGDRGERAA